MDKKDQKEFIDSATLGVFGWFAFKAAAQSIIGWLALKIFVPLWEWFKKDDSGISKKE